MLKSNDVNSEYQSSKELIETIHQEVSFFLLLTLSNQSLTYPNPEDGLGLCNATSDRRMFRAALDHF